MAAKVGIFYNYGLETSYLETYINNTIYKKIKEEAGQKYE
jgi:hypothetical protein